MDVHFDTSLIVSIVFLLLGSLMMAFSAGMLHERGAWLDMCEDDDDE